jgi:hypothetical protein
MSEFITESFLCDREDRLRKILENDLYEELYEFYETIFRAAGKSDRENCLVVFRARRSWVLCQIFAPLIASKLNVDVAWKNGLPANFVHDNMLSSWCLCRQNASPESVLIVDDTLLTGNGMRAFIERLHKNYNIDPNTIQIAVFRARINTAETKWYDENGDFRMNDGTTIPCECGVNNRVYKEEVVKHCSRLFIEAIRAVGMPYVANIAAFAFRYDKKISDAINRLDPSNGWIKKDLSLSNAMNIDKEREAFVLFPDPRIGLYARPSKDVELFTALRFYVDNSKQLVTFIPYSSINTVSIDLDIRKAIPKQLFNECRTLFDYDIQNDSECENQQQTYRILKYVSSYLIGKDFMECYLGISKTDYTVISYGGLHYAEDLFQLLERDEQWNWSDIWKHIHDHLFKDVEEPNNTQNESELEAKFDDEIKNENDIYQNSLIAKQPNALTKYIFRVYHKISKYTRDKHLSSKGILIEKLSEKLGSIIVSLDNFDFLSAILELGDFGGVITNIRLYRRNGRIVAIGTEAVCGEASVNSVAIIYPQLAWGMEQIRVSNLITSAEVDILRDIILKYLDSNDTDEAPLFGHETHRIVERLFTLMKEDPGNAVSPTLYLPLEDQRKDEIFYTNLVYWFESFKYNMTEGQESSIEAFLKYIKANNEGKTESNYKNCGDKIINLLNEGLHDR